MLQQVRGRTTGSPQTTTTVQRDAVSSLQLSNTNPYQQNQFQFPSTEPLMPVKNPQPRPQPQNQSHSRSSSFFSFRNKNSLSNQHQRTPSMANEGDGSASSLPYSLPPLYSSPGRTPDTAPTSQYAPQQSMTRTTSTQSPLARAPSAQGNAQAQSPSAPQSQPQSQPQPPPPAGPPPLHPEIRSVVNLTTAHAHKIYFSGPLVRRIERQPDGQRPHKDEGWTDVWAQLGGTTLSIWDMKQIQEASKQGREVPPTYVNTTDAFVQVLGSITSPASGGVPPKKYVNVLTLNTAGSNLLLFSCPTTAALLSWAAALRLSAWEKSRLEEIYTAHLIRITLNVPDSPSTLVNGQMEGWVRIRIAGQTDWKRMWMVVAAGAERGSTERTGQASLGIGSVPPPPTAAAAAAASKKRRMSNLFSRDHSNPHASGPPVPTISMYASSKPKDKKKALLTMKNVTQAFAVYPERPELISRSTLIKVEGTFGDEETAAVMKSREGWLLIMPELEPGLGQAAEMLKWVVALHDAFELYGRPERWSWDPRDPVSLMFAYPVGPTKELLFLDRELAETLDPREERTSAIRSRLIGILLDHMSGRPPQPQPPRVTPSETPPSLPPIRGLSKDTPQEQNAASRDGASSSGPSLPQLPPLSFGGTPSPQPPPPDKTQLTPITERTSDHTNGRTGAVDVSSPTHPGQEKPTPLHPASQEAALSKRSLAESPQPASPPSTSAGFEPPARSTPVQGAVVSSGPGPRSFDTRSINKGFQVQSRYNSNASNASSVTTLSKTHGDGANAVASPANVQLPLSPTSERGVFLSPSPPAAPVSEPSPPAPSPAPALSSPPSPVVPLKSPSSPPASLLTSPRSDAGHAKPDQQDSDRASGKFSMPTSPDTPLSTRNENRGLFASRGAASPTLQGQATAPPPTAVPSKAEDNHNFYNDAGAALYYMQQSEQEGSNFSQHRRVPTTIAEQDGDESSSSSYYGPPQPKSHSGTTSPQSGNVSVQNRSPDVRQDTPMAFVERSPSSNKSAANSPPGDRLSPSRQGLGRKPSGARAPQAARSYNGDGISSSQQVTEEEETQSEGHDYASPPKRMEQPARPAASEEDHDLDALAALSYLDTEDKPSSPKQAKVEPLSLRSTNMSPPPPPAPAKAEPATQFKSSFAPSKQAAERKAKAQAQQAAHHAAVHKPGRANGKRKSRISGAWNESSEEEEEEDEEEDDDQADSDAEPSLANKQGSGIASSNASSRHNQGQAEQDASQYSHLRPPRTLPQIPGNQNYSEESNPPPRRMVSDQFSERRTLYDGTQIRTQAEFPQPGAARQSVWSQVLDPGRNVNLEPQRDTFVQLDQAETMTKAFTPQGLLSAGMQDKQDRSAKRQEELARESGASLINVPNKPPPPQMGLLGAITAHERERKREGGVGAALTEREREKRMAEDRQRRFDEQQRQQMEQMQQGGSMYGGQYPGYGMMGNPMMMMNPMMGMNPMMTGGGMSPMMTGGGISPMMTGGGMAPMMTGQMGYPGMMPGYNPQHLFAAQQAAQAYQQAMMAFSVAGSQVGGDGAGQQQQQPMNPAMTGGGMGGGMGGFDPRMSMMGMPMMGAPQMAPMGMQMTGMSGFDPRFQPGMTNSPGSMNDPGLAPPAGFGGQNQTSSRNSSPAGRGSPLARPADASRGSSRPATPKS